MILKNKVCVTETYRGKSKFSFWKSLEVGDFIEVSIAVRPISHGGSGLYATQVRVQNLRTSEVFDTTMNMAAGYLNQIKYQEI